MLVALFIDIASLSSWNLLGKISTLGGKNKSETALLLIHVPNFPQVRLLKEKVGIS